MISLDMILISLIMLVIVILAIDISCFVETINKKELKNVMLPLGKGGDLD